jgi:hypothetical protein
MTTTTREQLQALLDIAGIAPSPEEVDELVTAFPETRARAERLWAVDLGDIPPALVFRAAGVAGPEEATGA